MEGVESVVIGYGDVGLTFDQQHDDVVTFLGDGIMERGVPFRVLQVRFKNILVLFWYYSQRIIEKIIEKEGEEFLNT